MYQRTLLERIETAIKYIDLKQSGLLVALGITMYGYESSQPWNRVRQYRFRPDSCICFSFLQENIDVTKTMIAFKDAEIPTDILMTEEEYFQNSLVQNYFVSYEEYVALRKLSERCV